MSLNLIFHISNFDNLKIVNNIFSTFLRVVLYFCPEVYIYVCVGGVYCPWKYVEFDHLEDVSFGLCYFAVKKTKNWYDAKSLRPDWTFWVGKYKFKNKINYFFLTKELFFQAIQ